MRVVLHAALCASVMLTVAGCAQSKPAAAPRAPKAVPAPGPLRPPAVLSPQATPEEQQRLTKLTNANLDSAEQRLKLLADRRLSAEQHDTVETIKGFIAKAREALGAKDLARASTLADKARVLSDELTRGVR
jgi:hypothetical protein